MNCIFLYNSSSPQITQGENSFFSVIDQSASFIPEIADTRLNLKVLTVSFAEKFFSFEFNLKKPGNQLKHFIIISETDSESNSRNSAFLITELSTST